MTGPNISIESGEAIRLFLINPSDKKKFDRFFKVCRDHTIATLRTLRARGYRLPLEKLESENPISDLTYDTLGTFFQSRPGQKYCVIYDYYRRHGVTDFENSSPDKLFELFRILISGFVARNVNKLGGDRNPQTENLKRRFNETLKSDKFTLTKSDCGSHAIVYLRKYSDDIRDKKPFLPFDRLMLLVESAFLKSNNRIEWCLKIFESLHLEDQYKNALKQHDLIAMVVKVNARYVDLSYRPNSFKSPDELMMQKEVAKAISDVTRHISETVIELFISKGKLTEDTAGRFRLAVGHYLTDLCLGGGADSKPTYFQLVMPEKYHDRYIPDYKHIFETTIEKSVKYLRQLVREKSIFSNYGHYFKDETDKG